MLKESGFQIYLRDITLADVTLTYVNWLNDREVNKYLETKYETQTIGSVANFVKSKVDSNTEFLKAICLSEDNQHIGNIKVGPVNAHHRTADVSLFIGESSTWGKGYAAQAIYLISKWAFATLEIEKLKAGCYSENVGSARAFEKCGYRKEGTLRGEVIFNSERMDTFQYGCLQNELKLPGTK